MSHRTFEDDRRFFLLYFVTDMSPSFGLKDRTKTVTMKLWTLYSEFEGLEEKGVLLPL